MKKVRFLLAFTLLLSLCIFPAFAEIKQVSIPELKLKVTPPEDWAVFTRKTRSSDPNILKYNIDKNTLIQYYKQNDIYLAAYLPDMPEIRITGVSNRSALDVFNLQKYAKTKDTAVTELTQKIVKDLAAAGMEITKTEQLSLPQALFLKLSGAYRAGDQSGAILQYLTFVNGNAVTLYFFSDEKTLPADTAAVLETMVKSVEFTKIYANIDELKADTKKQSNPLLLFLLPALCALLLPAAFRILGKRLPARFSLPLLLVNTAFLLLLSFGALYLFGYAFSWTPLWAVLLASCIGYPLLPKEAEKRKK